MVSTLGEPRCAGQAIIGELAILMGRSMLGTELKPLRMLSAVWAMLRRELDHHRVADRWIGAVRYSAQFRFHQ